MKRLFLFLATALLLTFPLPLRAEEAPEDILDLFRTGMNREEARSKAAPLSETPDTLHFRLEWAGRPWEVTLKLRQGKTAIVRWKTELDGKTAEKLRALLRKRGFVAAWYKDQDGRITDFLDIARHGVGKGERLRLFDGLLDNVLKAGGTAGTAIFMPESLFDECAGLTAPESAALMGRRGDELCVLGIYKKSGRLIFMTPP